MPLRPTAIALLAAAWPLATAGADVVQLESGGSIHGRLAPNDAARNQVIVELDGGGRIALSRSDVRRTIVESPESAKHRRRAAGVPDTAEANWELAEWCRQNRLSDQAAAHTRRVLELAPNHAAARQALGYSQHRGRWMTRDELMESRGMVRHNGEYRTPQEVELLERSERGKQSAADWRKQIARWRRDLGSSKPQEAIAAADKFAQLNDPSAAPALVNQLMNEQNPDAADLLIAVAARLDHPAAVQALAKLSLHSNRHEVRQQCLEHLIAANRPGLAEIYAKALRSKDNEIVNRAGSALGAVNAEETLGALIKALVTKHEFKQGVDTPKDTYSMSNGAFTFGGGKAKTIKVEMRNPAVRTALVSMTGENFGFDERAWRRWLANRTATEAVDLRRDL